MLRGMDAAGDDGLGGTPGAGERDMRHAAGAKVGRALTAAGRDPPARPAASRAAEARAGLGEELLEAAPDAMVVVDESGRIRRVNGQAEVLFGYQRDELIGAPLELLLPARFHDIHRTERSTYLAQPRRRPMGEDRDLFARRKDGTEFAVDISLSPLRTAEGLLVLAAVRDATERKRAQQEADARRAEAEALAEAAVVVARGTAAGAALHSILEGALRVVPTRVAFILLPRDDGAVLEIRAIVGDQERRLQRLPASHGVTGRAFRTGSVQAVGDVRTDPDYVQGARSIRSELAVPIVSGRTVVGVLNLEDDEPARFGLREVRLIEAFAAHVAAALETERLLAEGALRATELEARLRQQAAVADLGQRSLAGADVSALMEHAAVQVRETLGVSYAKVLELLPSGQEMLLRAGAGWKEGLVGSATVSADRGSQAGYTLFAHEPVIVEDLATETRFSEPALLLEHGVVSGISVIIRGDGGPYGVLGAHATERRAFTYDDVHFLQAVANVLSAAIQREHAEDRFRLLESAIENANDAVVVTDADLDPPGPRIIHVNPAYSRITGYAPTEVLGRSPRISQGPRTDADALARLSQALREGKTFRGEIVNYRKDGTEYDIEFHIAPIRDAAGRTTHFVSVQRDVTEHRRAQHELERLALYDSLTGLPNRSLFHDRLELAIAGARREGSPLALLLLDLDGFKDVNDTFGHEAGDELLQQVGPRFRGELREVDTVARLGGDEFGALLPGATEASAAKLARKLLTALDPPFAVTGQPVSIGASVGIAVYPAHGDTADLLLRCADVAMYAAKGSGSAFAVYAPDLDLHSPDRLAVIAELRQAIQGGGLQLHYQPIVNVATGRVTAVEALARWARPESGVMLPTEFIPIAEHAGLIRPLTERVLGDALRQQAAWRTAGIDLSVAVNVSMRNLVDADFPSTVERLLAGSGPMSVSLRLEITESVIMADPERALAILARLRRMGVGIDIDDFGTGYSSLAYLQRLPVEAVKIDRSFVGRMTSDDGSLAIVRSTIELCHSLGRTVVAEGVEDRETWEHLVALGCDEAQGHYVSAALAAPQLERWLTERRDDGGEEGGGGTR